MNSKHSFNTSTTSSSVVNISHSAAVEVHGYQFTIGGTGAHASGNASRSLETAVYNYLRALRALGRTTINTAEVAKALGVSIAEVDGTLESLKNKGVKTQP